MREKSDLDREFEEHEREQFVEQVRLCRALTDEERLAIFVADCASYARLESDAAYVARARRVADIERDEMFARLAKALD